MRDINKLKKTIRRILKRNGALRAGIFGSYARGDPKKNSDIDILVKLPKDLSLLDFVGIKLELEDALKKKVDLVEYHLIKQRIKKGILKEEIRVI